MRPTLLDRRPAVTATAPAAPVRVPLGIPSSFLRRATFVQLGPSTHPGPSIPPGPSTAGGAADAGAVSLALLADDDRLADLVPPSAGVERRRAGVMVLHRALTAMTHTVVAPLAIDGLALDLAADDVGYRATPGDEIVVWARDWRHLDDRDPTVAAGEVIGRLLDPVATAVRRVTGLPRTFVSRYLADQLVVRAERLARRHPAGGAAVGPDRLLAAGGWEPSTRMRRLPVDPDGAGPVELALPRVCCSVTGTKDPRDSCPTCPLLPDDPTRRARSRQWLLDLPSEEFVEVTGRPRR